MRSTAAPREPAARTLSSSSPAAAATSAREMSGTQPSGSPTMPVSITTGSAPSSRSRSRTYAISAPLVSRVPISAIDGPPGIGG